jgi:hypothetical protein
MKDWCLQHPYLSFIIAMSGITTLGNIVTKTLEIFIKPAPTTVNMNIDPSKIPGYSSHVVEEDGVVH